MPSSRYRSVRPWILQWLARCAQNMSDHPPLRRGGPPEWCTLNLTGRPGDRKLAHRRWVLTATILGSSMAFIDGTVVNIALPALQATMGATIADVQWVV